MVVPFEALTRDSDWTEGRSLGEAARRAINLNYYSRHLVSALRFVCLDNLTHSLVGLFLARAGFKKATPQATAILVLAANIPDLDAVSLLGGAETYIRWHRHLTHSLILLPLMALLAVALVRLLGRKPLRWLPAWGIALVGVSSHLLLDLTNIYGVRLLMPFSGRWFHWDITSIIDGWIWAILVLGIIGPALGRLVGNEIGDQKKSTGAGWAISVLVLLLGYDSMRGILRNQVVSQVGAQHYQGLTPRRAGAFPTGNPVVWTGVAELSNAYVMVTVSLLTGLHVNDADVIFKSEQTAEVNTAMRSETFQRFLEFVQWGIWVTDPSPDSEFGTRVTLVDLRFGTPRTPAFASVATVDRYGKLLNSYFTMSGTNSR